MNSEDNVKTTNLNGFLRNIETKSIINTEITNPSSTIVDTPMFFDTKSSNNFFLKHAQIVKTSCPYVNIAKSDKIKTSWSTHVQIIGKNHNDFDGNLLIDTLRMKDIYYMYVFSSDMKNDLRSNLQENFENDVKKAMETSIIESLLYGDGNLQPEGILHNTKEEYTINKETILEEMLKISAEMKKKEKVQNDFIWIMSPDFYAAFIASQLNSPNYNAKHFLNMPIYECNLMNKGQCVLVDLYHSLIIGINPNVEINNQSGVFSHNIGVKMQIGSMIKNKDLIKLITLKT